MSKMPEYKRMPLITSRQILKAYKRYGYWGLLVYGPLRCGKSSFTIQLLAEVYGILENPEWEKMIEEKWHVWSKWVLENTEMKWDAWRDRMVFEPKDFVTKVTEENTEQRVLLVWDDAGFWLSHYGFHHPFIKTVAEYLNVAASDWASLVFTTPNPRWVLTHVRRLPGGHTGRISMVTGNPYAWHHRKLRSYEGYIAPDLKKTGVRVLFDDQFHVMLPDKVFNSYDPVRRAYAQRAKDRMQATVHYIYEHKGLDKAKEIIHKLKEDSGVELDT